MVLHSQQVIIGTRPVLLYPADTDGVHLVISANADIYIGNSDLTTETGYYLPDGNAVDLELAPNELLYGLVEEGRATVYVLATMKQ